MRRPDSAAEANPQDASVGMDEAISVLRRNQSLIVLTTAILTAVAAIVIIQLPDRYISRSLVYIEPGRMPKSFERAGGVVPKLSQLVGLLRQEVMSRDVLRGVINELDLYEQPIATPLDMTRPIVSDATAGGAGADAPGAAREPPGFFERLFWEDPIERAKRDIKFDIVRRYNDDYLEISVKARAADLAAKAVNRISDILAMKNREMRIKRAHDVGMFLDSELAKVSRQAMEDEAAHDKARAEGIDSLPENEHSLVTRQYLLGTSSMDRKRRIEDVNAQRARVEQKLSRLSAGGGQAQMEARVALELDIQRLEAVERLIAQKRPARHPDLIRARAELERARRRLATLGAPSPDRTVSAASPPPLGGAFAPAIGGVPGAASEVESVERLASELEYLIRVQDALARDQESESREIARIEARQSLGGAARQKVAKAKEALDESVKLLNELKNDRRDIERFIVATDAMQGDQFRTIEAAEAPPVPEEPKRLRLIGLAFGGAVATGFGAAFLAHALRRTYRTSHEVEENLGLMVLAVLPDMRHTPIAPPPQLPHDREGEGPNAPDAEAPPS